MLKKYRNQLANYIAEKCIIPIHDLEISFPDESNIIVKHLKSEFLFSIDQNQGTFDWFYCRHTQFLPGFPISEYKPFTGPVKFDDIISYLDEWFKRDVIEYLQELDTPDFLELLINNKRFIDPTNLDFSTNQSFTAEEKNILSLGLNEIKSLILEQFNFTNNQLEIVNERISYLEIATERLGKLDWKNILISTVLSIIITLSLDTAKGQLLWDLFSKILNNLPQLPLK